MVVGGEGGKKARYGWGREGGRKKEADDGGTKLGPRKGKKKERRGEGVAPFFLFPSGFGTGGKL